MDNQPAPTENTQQQSPQEYISRRERRIAMKTQRGSSEGMSRGMRRVLLWGGSFVVLGLIGWGMVRLSAGVTLPTDVGVLADEVSAQDHVTGRSDAPVTLVEYSDFQCPACAAYYPLVKQALAEPDLKDKVRFAYRSFPLTNIHPNAMLAARAAEAASVQGKFWEMHDVLFEKQSSWAGLSSKGARDAFIGYGKTLGLDTTKLSSDLDSGAVKDAVDAQIATGTRSSISSTPTFYVNGKKMAQPRSYEEFRKFITDAIPTNP